MSQCTGIACCKWLRPIMRGILAALILAGFFGSGAWGQAETADDMPDMRVLVDVSASMRDSDPDNLRVSAAHLLIELLPQGSSAGLWTFGRLVNMLIAHDTVDEPWRRVAREQAGKIASPGQFTNIAGAFDTAAFDFAWSTGARPKTYVLISDGRVSMPPDDAASGAQRERILNTLIPRLNEHNATVYTIGLSDDVDQTLMEQLAVRTGGTYFTADGASTLLGAFLDILNMSLGGQEELPLSDNQTFTIDDTVNEFTAVLFSDDLSEVRLQDPSGNEWTPQSSSDAFRWQLNEAYRLVTVSDPEPGEWRFTGQLTDSSRISVLADLSLQVEAPPLQAAPGQRLALRALLNSREGQVTDREFLDVVSVGAEYSPEASGETRTAAMARTGDLFVGELALPETTGRVRLAVQAQTGTFVRQRVFTVSIPDPVTLEVLPDEGQYELRAFLNLPETERSDTRLIADITGPDGEQRLAEFSSGQGNRWRLTVTPFDGDGVYRINVDARLSGGNRPLGAVRVEPVQITFPGTAGPAVTPEPAPEPEPAPQEETGSQLEPWQPEDFAVAEAPGSNPAPSTDEELVPIEEESPGWWLYALAAGGGLLVVAAGYLIMRLRRSGTSSPESGADQTDNTGRSAGGDSRAAEVAAQADDGKPLDTQQDDVPTVSDEVTDENEFSVFDDDFDLDSFGFDEETTPATEGQSGESDAGDNNGAQVTPETGIGEQPDNDPNDLPVEGLEDDDRTGVDEPGGDEPDKAPEGTAETPEEDPFSNDEFDLSDEEIDRMLDDNLLGDEQDDDEPERR